MCQHFGVASVTTDGRATVYSERVREKLKVGFLYSATYTANQNSALHNLGSGS